MESESSVLAQSTELFFKLLHSRFDGVKVFELEKTLDEAKLQLNHAFEPKMLGDTEREALSVYLGWLFHTLLNFAVTDIDGIVTKKNIDLQKAIIMHAYNNQRWWFSKLLNAYTSVIEQTVLCNDHEKTSKELEIPLSPSTAVLKRSKLNVTFPKIVITTKKEHDNILDCCISVLTHVVPEFVNMKQEQGLVTRATMLEVFCHKSLRSKNNAIVFFRKYFTSLVMINNEDTQFFLSVLHTLSVIYKDIPMWVSEDQKQVLDEFQKSVQYFLRTLPVEDMIFDNQQNIQRFVTYASEILYHQINNAKSFWYKYELVFCVANMIKSVLDKFDYTEAVTASLLLLSDSSDPDIVSLMKYPIVAELEAAPTFHKQASKTSKTWQNIHRILTAKVESLSLQTEQFTREVQAITDFSLLAVHVEFVFTQRHQFHHGMHPKTCICASIENHQEPPPSSLMKFKDWDYNHINLEMFENVESFTQKLLNALNNCKSVDAHIVVCFIDIFSSVLKFALSSQLLDIKKQILLAIVASPFYKSLKDEPQFNNLAGFQKVMTLLPRKFQEFFETRVECHHLEQMKVDSIMRLSQIEISAINNQCWWLTENIMQSVMMQKDEKLKSTLFCNFANFIVNNSDKFSQCVDRYQKLLMEVDNRIVVDPLHEILCLSGGKLLILKTNSSENHFNHFIVCDTCKLSTIVYPKSPKTNELNRRMALMKDTKGVLISPDRIAQASKQLVLDAPRLMSQPNEFKLHLMSKIPAMLTHSQNFQAWVESDKGRRFFEAIFVCDEKVLEKVDKNLHDILQNIKQIEFDEVLKTQILNACFTAFSQVLKVTAYVEDQNLQHLTANIAFTYVENVPTEFNLVKCFKVFSLYIVQNSSKIMGEASNNALTMAYRNDITLEQLLTWHRTFIMRHVVHLCITNFFKYKTSLLNSLINFTRRINIPRMRDFLPQNLSVIVAIVLPKAVQSSKLMLSLDELCQVNQTTVSEVFEDDFIKVYANIYINEERPEVVKKCEEFFEKTTKTTIAKRLRANQKKTLEETLLYYNVSSKFVMEVMEKMLGSSDPDLVAETINNLLLCVLIYFEPLLASNVCERVVKKNILLSLGDLIRMLGSARISPICFKIIALLKAAVEQTDQDLSEPCIQVWDILIRICNVETLGPILSTIFVSLETFIDKYPKEVNGIFKYLIEDNASLLSRHISDLFFIKKTRVDQRIKKTVLQLMESQKMRDEVDFRSNLQSLMRHMNSENSDLKIRVYCLQYITELFQNNRDQLNEMICGQMSIDPIIEDLLLILVNNCKASSKEIQLATAECLGELGAIEPSLQHQNYASQKEFPKTILSEEFAKMALEQLCRSYQYKNDSKYIDALSLAIQSILKTSKVTVDNRADHPVWQAIPEKMRPLLEPLITSGYVPKSTQPTENHPIFLTLAQTPSDWALIWAVTLIAKIPQGDTRSLLEGLRPSMKHNQYTTSTFLPYMLLHCLEVNNPSTQHEVVREIQFVFDVLMGKDILEKEKTDEPKPLFVKLFDFEPVELKKKMAGMDINTVTIKIAKMIFEMFDFLENFIRTNTEQPEMNHIVAELLNSFDLEEMAHVNYNCGEYARALIYLEAKMKTVDEDQQKYLPFLARTFAKLSSTDSVQGVQALKTSEWSLQEKILITNITGNHQDSVASCERMMQIGDATIEHVQSMVNSYIALDQPETALLVYEKMMSKLMSSTCQRVCDDIKAEPLWRLSRFDELEALLAEDDIKQSTSWGVQCGKLLLKFRSDDDEFFSELSNTRLALMKNLKISGSEQAAYGKNYQEIVNLHLITEFEKTEKALEEVKKRPIEGKAVEIVQNLIGEWHKRMEFVEKNGAIEEPILGFHRIILNEMKLRMQRIFGEYGMDELNCVINGEISKLWMQSTKLACKNKMFQQAQIYILNAETYHPKELFLEKAKLNWLKNDQNGAFKILEMGVKEILGNTDSADKLTDDCKKIFSKAKMMIARYNAEAINVEFETNKRLFKEAKVKGAENEKLFLLTADYMDRHYSGKEDGGRSSEMTEVMKAYLQSMMYGNESVFQSMPRFLSIWLDTTATSDKQPNADFAAMNKLAAQAADKLSPFYFYTAFSQLISRLCHPSTETFTVLKKILVKLIYHHPQQSLWYLVPMLKSTNSSRAGRCKEILNGDIIKNQPMQQLIQEFNSLIDKFIKLSSIQIRGNERVLSLQTFLPELSNFLKSKPSRIIIPFQSNLQLIRVCKQSTFKFNHNIVKIHSIKDKIDVMASLQKPRKVTLIGDDGKEYPALFKPNDDCRIDQRFMEFSSVLKEFLHKDPESRRRQLTTRTYCVIPLSETAGFIEWVPNLRPYKDIIMKEYKKKGHRVPNMTHLGNLNIDRMKKEDQIIEYRKLIKLFYPALGDYFRQQFPSPQNYFKARSAFIKSTAIWSIVGYIMGLGDRHGENILIDVCSGETFHVDCNLLFNKGETLNVPETVPFRLTHNMIDAMGVLGIEGPFRKSCEIVLRVLQKEERTLLAYVRPIIYDTHKKSQTDLQKRESGRQINELMEIPNLQKIQRVKMRLKGIVQKYKGSSEIPLSTEGQVNFLIKEATSEENLAAMYRGWVPWM